MYRPFGSRVVGLLPVLLMAVGMVAAAQEPPPASHPAPKPGAAAPKEDRLVLLAHRHARVGVSVNLRARSTDSIGAYINGVTPGGPAAKAGLRSGDVITRLGGKPLVDSASKATPGRSAPGLRLIELAARLEPDDTIAVEFRRGNETRTVKLIAAPEPDIALGALLDPAFELSFPPEVSEAVRQNLEDGGDGLRSRLDRLQLAGGPWVMGFGAPLADLELAPINPELGRYFGVTEGILVISIPSDSKLNLKPGDVVLSVDGRIPSSPAHLMRILRSYEPGEQFKLDVMRMKKKEAIVGRVSEAPKDKTDEE
jgi:membrane-associated protease RseP (regulator of RpoE activity)